jgi:hypothetical protein
MRLLTFGPLAASLALPLLLTLAGCTAQGSSTTVQGPPASSSGSPVFPGTGDGTTSGGTTTEPGTTDYAALFGPPASTSATSNSLNGLWAGTSGYSNADTRLKLSGTSIVIAQKCGSDAIGIDIVAHVTASSIKTLESKTYTPAPTTSTGSGTSSGTKASSACSLSVMPIEVTRCTSTTDADASYESTSLDGGCFFLSGTKLTFYSSTGFLSTAKLTKLSD